MAGKNKPGAGRPEIEIDRKQFEGLCKLQATLEEISGFFDVSDETIERWCIRTYKKNFAEVFKQKKGLGKISLRRRQFLKAMDGDTALLIFLGKNWLNQRDKAEFSSEEEKEFVLNYVVRKPKADAPDKT